MIKYILKHYYIPNYYNKLFIICFFFLLYKLIIWRVHLLLENSFKRHDTSYQNSFEFGIHSTIRYTAHWIFKDNCNCHLYKCDYLSHKGTIYYTLPNLFSLIPLTCAVVTLQLHPPILCLLEASAGSFHGRLYNELLMLESSTTIY